MTRSEQSLQASARFFIRVGQTGRATEPKDIYTLPLFPLPMIMDCEGLLSRECRNLTEARA
jgi:hypothetical protein